MRPLNCLDHDREHKAPAPLGSVKSESTGERLARLIREAQELPEDSAAVVRWRAHFNPDRRRA